MKTDILTIKEVAKYLKLKDMTVYRLAKKGSLPASKVGGMWRFKKERIDQWLRDHEQKPGKKHAKR